MFKEIKASDIKENICDLLKNNWGLVTAGNSDKFNTMTVSWGSMGELWGKDSVTVYIRPQRYTEEFMNSNDHFTLSFYPLDKKQAIHGICGSKSGRDVDKVKECNLTPNFDENAPYSEEAQLVLVCKKMAKSKFDPKDFTDASIDGRWYPEKDYHYIYFAEIEKVLISE